MLLADDFVKLEGGTVIHKVYTKQNFQCDFQCETSFPARKEKNVDMIHKTTSE